MSYKPKPKIFDDKENLSHSFIKELIEISNSKIEERGEFNLFLSGGSTPNGIYKLIAEEYKSHFDWKNIKFFWGDERCVPPDDEESNYGTVKRLLLDEITIPEENINRIFGERNPTAEVKRYEETLIKNLPQKNNLPQIDLLLLGIGDDGHTASIFPNDKDVINSNRFCEVAKHPISKQKRITITNRLINNSNQIIFLATGKNKKEIVKNILDENEFYKYPAGVVISENKNVTLYLDKNTSSQLS